MEIYRCQDCGELLNAQMIARGCCAGHRIKIANRGTLLEWIKVQLWKIQKKV